VEVAIPEKGDGLVVFDCCWIPAFAGMTGGDGVWDGCG
jgi:hypothetical protein